MILKIPRIRVMYFLRIKSAPWQDEKGQVDQEIYICALNSVESTNFTEGAFAFTDISKRYWYLFTLCLEGLEEHMLQPTK